MFNISRLNEDTFKVLTDRLHYNIDSSVKINNTTFIHDMKYDYDCGFSRFDFPERLSCTVTNPKDGNNNIIFEWKGYNVYGALVFHGFTKYNLYNPKLGVKPYIILCSGAVTHFRNALQHSMTELVEYEYAKHREDKTDAE
jgi:hypothetical protein